MDGINLIYYLVCILWYAIFVSTIVYLNYHHNVEHERTFKEKFLESVPSPLNPGELSTLMYRKIRPDAFASTILILIKKEILILKKSGDNYILTINRNIDAKLSASQKYLVDFLINTIGNGEKVSFVEIEDICNSSNGCSTFLMNYKIWLRMMYKESSKKRFFEDKLGYSKIKTLQYLGILLFITNIIGRYHLVLGYFIIIPSIFIVYFFYKIFKRTKSANDEYYKWLAFKNYLLNIEKFKYNKNEIDTYLIYGVILNIKGLEKKVTRYEYIDNLNNMINRCVVKANLYGSRNLLKDEL